MKVCLPRWCFGRNQNLDFFYSRCPQRIDSAFLNRATIALICTSQITSSTDQSTTTPTFHSMKPYAIDCSRTVSILPSSSLRALNRTQASTSCSQSTSHICSSATPSLSSLRALTKTTVSVAIILRSVTHLRFGATVLNPRFRICNPRTGRLCASNRLHPALLSAGGWSSGVWRYRLPTLRMRRFQFSSSFFRAQSCTSTSTPTLRSPKRVT